MHVREKIMTGKDSREHAHGGSGVAAVETFRRPGQMRSPFDFQSSLPVTTTVTLLRSPNHSSHLLQALKRAGAIRSQRVIRQARGSLGECCQHGVTMRDGLIARKA